MKSEKTTLNRLQSSPFLNRKSFALPVLALLSITSMSAQQVTLLDDNFTSAVRVENPTTVFTGVDRDGVTPIVADYAIAYNNLSAPLARTDAIAPKVVSSGGINGNSLSIGSGAVAVSLSTYLAPTELGAGGSISVSLNIRTSAAPSALATTFRIGLFDSNGGGNLVQNTTYIDSAFTDDRGYAAFFGTGTAVTHDVRERNANALQNIFRPTDFTLVGTAVTASNSVLANTTYPVTLNITRSLDGLAVGITGTFNGVTVSATDAAALVTDFDHLAVQFGSQFGGTEWIDDVVVAYTPAPPLTPDLLAYYPFDSGFNDASGNNNHLIKSSGSPGITNTPEQLRVGSGALNLNQSGTQQHLRFTAPLDFDGTRAWSMAWWGKRSASGLTSQGMIAGTITDSNDFVWTPNAAGVVQGLRLRNGSAFNADYNSIPDDNAFHHWAVSYNGAGQVTVWRDNSSLGTKTFSGNVKLTHVGAGTNSNTHSFFGQLDDLYFYDGAINAANVNELFTTPPGTVGFLLCERWNSTPFYSTSELVSNSSFYGIPHIIRYDKPIATSSLYQGTYFSTRTRGWITIPETGGYRFWISARNGAQLLLSTAGTKYTKRVIAELNPELGTGNGIRKDSTNLWDVYGSQMSEEIQLTAGQSYYLETIHTNGHGSNPHASIAWARPGMARTALDLAYVQPYAPTADDADDDYLPDAWESQYNLDPLDNGLTDLIRQGERGDFDGDGLSNREEYLLGTNPGNSDTDGDGETDGNEVNALGSNALVANAITDTFLSQFALGTYVSSTANWTMTSGGLLADSFRGEATWDFSVPSAGNWLFRLDLELMGATYGNEEVPIVIKVDGKTVVRKQVRFGSGKFGLLQALSPWLIAGNHQISVLVDNSLARRTVRLVSLKIFEPSNPNAILAQENRVVNRPSGTRTSPAFIEGYARDPSTVTLNGVPAQIGTGNGHWFANVALSNLSAAQPYTLQYEQGWQGSGTFTWQASNVMDAETLTIRRGDTLRVGAWGTDSAMPSTVTVSSGGTTPLIGQETTTLTFTTAGVFTVSGSLQSGATANLTVKVIAPPSFPAGTVDALENCLRTLSVAAAPEVEFDTQENLSRLILSRTSTTASVGILPAQPVELGVAARLFTGGPILAIQRVNVIAVSDALQNDLTSVSASNVPGYKLLQTPLTVLNLPPGARVDVNIFRAGVMFSNGTTLKSVYPADLTNGSTILQFLFPLGQSGGYCHNLLVYDRNGLYLGTR
jgi:hypothetical protein